MTEILVLESRWHRALKEHKCNWCGGVIPVGDRYLRQRNIDEDNEAYTFKSHYLCDQACTKAAKDMDLWPEDSPDWGDDIRPLMDAVWHNLARMVAS